MLIKLSEICRAGCSHCFENATADGDSMDIQTLLQSIEFARSVNDHSLLISGGECSEHPDFANILRMLNDVIANDFQIFILTHGGWLNDTPQALAEHPNLLFQVTADPLYYPKLLKTQTIQIIESAPNAMLTTNLNDAGLLLFPLGRAISDLGVTSETTRYTAPASFNLRSMICHSDLTLREAVTMLRQRGKACTPSINTDGSLSMGETRNCGRAGTVWSTHAIIERAIKETQCNNCGLTAKLSPEYQRVINFQN
ncbi:radical SAM protein [Vibrio breoganii]